MDGDGLFKWNDGKSYQGQFKKGKLDGWGIYDWGDGRKYEGNYEADQK